ncbi:HD domain-containing protein [Halobacillus litoralis]|uniref:HD domain-containing protein n=1 Tax=Halobacillus litoralis TaxID=45668 RepID=UPI001CFE210F|nr:HD domain-containing protein [Halobacillus litoralis]
MIQKAKIFATEAHKGQKRKNSSEDYIVHPVRVADILQESGFNEALICAGYLHDVVEDTNYTLLDIQRTFGRRIKELVAAHTEDKSQSWKKRKQQTIEVVKHGSLEVKALIIADKLDNLRSISKDLQNSGPGIWRHFNAAQDQQKWYYTSIAHVMEHGLSSNLIPSFFDQYRTLVKQTFD